MLPDSGSIFMGVDYRNHQFAPELSPGWAEKEGVGVAPSPAPLAVWGLVLSLSRLELSDNAKVYEPSKPGVE